MFVHDYWTHGAQTDHYLQVWFIFLRKKVVAWERCRCPKCSIYLIYDSILCYRWRKILLPVSVMCNVIFYSAHVRSSEAQVYCNMPEFSHNIDGSGKLYVIHECLTPLRTWQRSFRDQAVLIKAMLCITAPSVGRDFKKHPNLTEIWTLLSLTVYYWWCMSTLTYWCNCMTHSSPFFPVIIFLNIYQDFLK